MNNCYHCGAEESQLELIVQDQNNTKFKVCRACSKFFAVLKRVLDDPENQKIMELLGDD